MLQTLIDFPWDKLAAFFAACIGFITLIAMLFPRVERIRNWIGQNIQDMFGVGGLRRDLQANMDKVNGWIELHTTQAQARDVAIAKLTRLIGDFVEASTDIHDHPRPD